MVTVCDAEWAPDVSEDGVAVALGDGFYVEGDWYRQERRNAGNKPRTRILNDSGSGNRWIQSDAERNSDAESCYCSSLVSMYV
jgi:hypothetical protein